MSTTSYPIYAQEVPETLESIVAPESAATPAVVSTKQASNDSDRDQGYVINFNNVDIKEYLRFISRISGRNFIYDDKLLNFRVTIISEEPAPLENILTSLVHTLRINNLTLLEEGNNFLIHANPGVKGMAPLSVDAKETDRISQEGAEFVTRLFRLRNISVATARPVIATLISPQATLESSEETNHIILTDIITNVEKIGELLKELDSLQTRLEIGQYRGQRMRINELVALADRIITPLAGENAFFLIPRAQTNSVFIVTTNQLLKRTIEVMSLIDSGWTQTGLIDDSLFGSAPDSSLLEGQYQGLRGQTRPDGLPAENSTEAPEDSQLIVPPGFSQDGKPSATPSGIDPTAQPGELPPGAGPNDTEFCVIGLHYRRGDQLQSALGTIVGGLGASQSDIDLSITIGNAQWLENTNCILLSGSSKSIARAKRLIEELDKPVRQVLIEMLIMETGIDNSLNFGLELGVRHQSPSWSSTFGSMVPGFSNSPLPPALDAVTATSLLGGNTLSNSVGLNLGGIGRVITHNGNGFTAIGALLTALNEDSETEVLLNPKIITENNVPAEIFVGSSIPFRGQTISNDLGNVLTTNIEYRDVGTRLRVTPFLGPCSDVITLEIEQEISREDPNQSQTAADLGQPTLQTSTTTTRVHVPNNYFLMISGLLQDESTKQHARVPCLGGIPFFGAAFKDENNQIRKINVMVFIRPTIIDTADDIEEMTKRQQNQYLDNLSRPDPLSFEVSEGLKWLNLCVPK